MIKALLFLFVLGVSAVEVLNLSSLRTAVLTSSFTNSFSGYDQASGKVIVVSSVALGRNYPANYAVYLYSMNVDGSLVNLGNVFNTTARGVTDFKVVEGYALISVGPAPSPYSGFFLSTAAVSIYSCNIQSLVCAVSNYGSSATGATGFIRAPSAAIFFGSDGNKFQNITSQVVDSFFTGINPVSAAILTSSFAMTPSTKNDVCMDARVGEAQARFILVYYTGASSQLIPRLVRFLSTAVVNVTDFPPLPTGYKIARGTFSVVTQQITMVLISTTSYTESILQISASGAQTALLSLGSGVTATLSVDDLTGDVYACIATSSSVRVSKISNGTEASSVGIEMPLGANLAATSAVTDFRMMNGKMYIAVDYLDMQSLTVPVLFEKQYVFASLVAAVPTATVTVPPSPRPSPVGLSATPGGSDAMPPIGILVPNLSQTASSVSTTVTRPAPTQTSYQGDGNHDGGNLSVLVTALPTQTALPVPDDKGSGNGAKSGGAFDNLTSSTVFGVSGSIVATVGVGVVAFLVGSVGMAVFMRHKKRSLTESSGASVDYLN